MFFKLTNMLNTRFDPRRKRTSRLTRRPVRLGQIKVSPCRTLIIDENTYAMHKRVIDAYMDEGVLSITSDNKKEFQSLRLNSDYALCKEAAVIVQPVEEAVEIVYAEPVEKFEDLFPEYTQEAALEVIEAPTFVYVEPEVEQPAFVPEVLEYVHGSSVKRSKRVKKFKE